MECGVESPRQVVIDLPFCYGLGMSTTQAHEATNPLREGDRVMAPGLPGVREVIGVAEDATFAVVSGKANPCNRVFLQSVLTIVKDVG